MSYTHEELNTITEVRNRYNKIAERYPEVIERVEKLPARVKSAKQFDNHNVNVLRKKGLSLFAQQGTDADTVTVETLTFEKLLDYVVCEYGESRLPLSQEFWPIYETIKSYREVIRSNKNELAIESKAHDNLKVALKVIDPTLENDIDFIKTIIKDIKHYYTLPKYSLRRLGSERLTPNSAKKKWNLFFDELHDIKKKYGADYLDKILETVKNQKEEVIIAVENRD